jgi:hypothetical protein
VLNEVAALRCTVNRPHRRDRDDAGETCVVHGATTCLPDDLSEVLGLPVQSGARCDGIAGIYGNVGIVESATC